MTSSQEQPSGMKAALGSSAFRRLLIVQPVSSLGAWVATLAFVVAAFALTQNQTAVAVVLILRLVAALFGLLRLVASNTPHWIPFAQLFRDHPTSFAFFFDGATFVFSASMIAGIPMRRHVSPEPFELFRDVAEGFRFVARDRRLRSL